MTTSNPSDLVDPFLRYALQGDGRRAAELALGLLDSGVPAELVIRDLLAAAQSQVGDRWQANELNIADEHVATGVTQTALHAVAAATPAGDQGLVVSVCAEGDWHGLAAHMFAEQLRAHGTAVSHLGASTPAEHLGHFIDRHRPDALVVSCSVPLFYTGVARVADVAHAHGIPVLAGGRALAGEATARMLGVDGWADNLPDALGWLSRWREQPPPVCAEPTALSNTALILDAGCERMAATAFGLLGQRFPTMADSDTSLGVRALEDLASIIKFVAAAMLVDEPAVLTDFLDWTTALLAARDAPATALYAGLEVLQPLLDDVGAGALGAAGLTHLAVCS